MNTRPRLTRSIPFWLLVGGSLASAGAGAFLLVDKLGVMSTTLTSGTATGVEVYVGQIWGVLGAILVGAGVVGLLLAFGLAALRAYAPAAVESPAHVDDAAELEAPSERDAVDTASDLDLDESDPTERSTLETAAR